jgi:glucose/arabinose dehydrogenase
VAGAGAAPAFTDVAPTDLFSPHIVWMGEEGIADGFADGTFRPSQVVTRGAMAAFLYRAAGEPPFVDPATPQFSDVRVTDLFFTEIEWLAAQGITEGFDDGTFRPSRPTSRAAMAAYLYRFAEESLFADPPVASFADVPTTDPFFTEVEWLVAEQVTSGFGDGTFRPSRAVTRASMSAFIFRVTHLAPTLTVDEGFVTDLVQPWDLAWTPDGYLLFDQQDGEIFARAPDGTLTPLHGDVPGTGVLADFQAWGEAGMTGLVVDPDFGTNRSFYTCQLENDRGDSPADVDPGDDFAGQVVRWTVDAGYTSATRQEEVFELAEWYPNPGGHFGCRLRFGADGHLYISTGDRRCGTFPQDLTVMAGKVLRIDKDTGAGAPGNPFSGGDTADDAVFTYGHRNPQGLALRSDGQMWSVEHGSFRDDEVNLLVAGANNGWNPVNPDDPVACAEAVPGPDTEAQWYDEDHALMTDLVAFPDADPAEWSSGTPTIATSGGTFLEGGSWGGWQGALAVATLNGQHLRLLFFTDSGVFIEQRRPLELDHTFGRLRTAQMGPGEALYVSTSIGQGSRIIEVTAAP